MSTFLDLYVSLIGFVNYKLYADAQLVYPPKLDAKKAAEGAGISSFVLESTLKDVEVEEMDEGEEVMSKRVCLLFNQVSKQS
jgi:pescadillo protein